MYRVVIADDERIIREGIKSLDWEAHGMQIVAEAKNGIEAIEIIDSMQFDLLLTDIKMPGAMGIELIQYLHEVNSQAKTVILSGYGEFEYACRVLKLGGFDYILKPSTPKEILQVAKRACEAVKKERLHVEQVEELSSELNRYKEVVGVGTVRDERDTDIKRIITYIYQHYMDELTLAKLADFFHFNTVYLSAYIKKNTGHSFLEILTSIRMHHAGQLLKTTNLKNGEVGIKVGIPDERYFGQVFKKTYKITPYEYKKNKGTLQMPVEDWITMIGKRTED